MFRFSHLSVNLPGRTSRPCVSLKTPIVALSTATDQLQALLLAGLFVVPNAFVDAMRMSVMSRTSGVVAGMWTVSERRFGGASFPQFSASRLLTFRRTVWIVRFVHGDPPSPLASKSGLLFQTSGRVTAAPQTIVRPWIEIIYYNCS